MRITESHVLLYRKSHHGKMAHGTLTYTACNPCIRIHLTTTFGLYIFYDTVGYFTGI